MSAGTIIAAILTGVAIIMIALVIQLTLSNDASSVESDTKTMNEHLRVLEESLDRIECQRQIYGKEGAYTNAKGRPCTEILRGE